MVLHKNIKGILNIRDEITPAERHLLYLGGLRPTSSPDQLDPIGPALSRERRVGRAAVFFSRKFKFPWFF